MGSNVFDKIMQLNEKFSGAEEVDEQSQEEAFEEKLLESVDALSEKSAQARTQALEALSNALSTHFIPDFVLER
jgi:Interferon-related developmental regulator (IFRD)